MAAPCHGLLGRDTQNGGPVGGVQTCHRITFAAKDGERVGQQANVAAAVPTFGHLNGPVLVALVAAAAEPVGADAFATFDLARLAPYADLARGVRGEEAEAVGHALAALVFDAGAGVVDGVLLGVEHAGVEDVAAGRLGFVVELPMPILGDVEVLGTRVLGVTGKATLAGPVLGCEDGDAAGGADADGTRPQHPAGDIQRMATLVHQ